MDVANALALWYRAHRLIDRAVRRAPADDRDPALLRPVLDVLRRNELRDGRDLVRAQVRHRLMVLRVVRDVAGAQVLLEAADPIHQARRAWDDPRPPERLGIAIEDHGADLLPRLARLRGVRLDLRDLVDVRDQPG